MNVFTNHNTPGATHYSIDAYKSLRGEKLSWHQKISNKDIIFYHSNAIGIFEFDGSFNKPSNQINQAELDSMIKRDEEVTILGKSSFVEVSTPLSFNSLFIGQEAEIVSIHRAVINEKFSALTKVLKAFDAIKSTKDEFNLTTTTLNEVSKEYIFIPVVVTTSAYCDEPLNNDKYLQNGYLKLIIITDIPQSSLLKFSRCRTYLNYIYQLVCNGKQLKDLFPAAIDNSEYNESIKKILPTLEKRKVLDSYMKKSSTVTNEDLSNIRNATEIKKSEHYRKMQRDFETTSRLRSKKNELEEYANNNIANIDHYKNVIADSLKKRKQYEDAIVKIDKDNVLYTERMKGYEVERDRLTTAKTEVEVELAKHIALLSQKMKDVLALFNFEKNDLLKQRLLESNAKLLSIQIKNQNGPISLNDPDLIIKLMDSTTFISNLVFEMVKPISLNIYDFHKSRTTPEITDRIIGPVRFEIQKQTRTHLPTVWLSYTGSDTNPIVYSNAGIDNRYLYHTLHPHCQVGNVLIDSAEALHKVKQSGCGGELTPVLEVALLKMDIFSIVNIVMNWFKSTDMHDGWASPNYKHVAVIKNEDDINKKILVKSEDSFEFVTRLHYLKKEDKHIIFISYNNSNYLIENEVVTKFDSKAKLLDALTQRINDGWLDQQLISKYVSYFDATKHLCFEDIATQTIQLVTKETK